MLQLKIGTRTWSKGVKVKLSSAPILFADVGASHKPGNATPSCLYSYLSLLANKTVTRTAGGKRVGAAKAPEIEWKEFLPLPIRNSNITQVRVILRNWIMTSACHMVP